MYQKRKAVYGVKSPSKKAVEVLEGWLLVLAPAGTGKTGVLSMRILKALKKGVAPQEILCLTFTNRALHPRKTAGSIVGKQARQSRHQYVSRYQ